MANPRPHIPGRKLLTAIACLLFIGGLIGSALSFVKVSHHLPAHEYVGITIGTALWLVSSAVVVFIRSRL